MVTPAAGGPRPARLVSVDALRGAVMIVMALDHVRDFFHRAAMSQSPTDLATTTPVLFLTRWITHFCAPTFMITAGMGAYLWWRTGTRTRGQLSWFLITRGLWLMALEVTAMQMAYTFDVAQRYPLLLLVLWVLGACMIGLAALAWLPERILLGLSVATIALHNLLDGITVKSFGVAAPLWNLLHQVGVFVVAGRPVLVGYPLVPWIAVMAAGFCLAALLLREPAMRQRALIRIGLALTVGFVVVRLLNIYGDPSPWRPQASAVYTLLSFLNTTKYPPSLQFVLMTIGPALLALAWLDRHPPGATNPLVVFGRVPLFYYVLHFVAAHLLVVVFAFARYGGAAASFIFHPVPSMGGPRNLYPADFGYDLWVAYAVWIGIVVMAYPACRWFAQIKATRRDWWLSYL